MARTPSSFYFFFFNDTATTEIYTLSLHDALPISSHHLIRVLGIDAKPDGHLDRLVELAEFDLLHERHGLLNLRSEEHTSELQSRSDLVCRLLLEKKKKYIS